MQQDCAERNNFVRLTNTQFVFKINKVGFEDRMTKY